MTAVPATSGPTRNPDDWIIGAGRAGGKRTIVRALSKVPSVAERGDRNVLILVTWTYRDSESGMPDGAILAAIETFETALFASIHADNWASEAAAITGNGAKQWRFYTEDAQDFMTRFTAAMTGHPVYPIEIEAHADPEWQALQELHPA